MSRSNSSRKAMRRAVALQYGADDAAPVIVASGMGYMAEKIVEVAADSGVPIYEDNSLATILTQLKLGQEVPEELYTAIVEIYVYFLKFDPAKRDQSAGSGAQPAPPAAAASQPAAAAQPAAAPAPALGRDGRPIPGAPISRAPENG